MAKRRSGNGKATQILGIAVEDSHPISNDPDGHHIVTVQLLAAQPKGALVRVRWWHPGTWCKFAWIFMRIYRRKRNESNNVWPEART